MRVLTVVLHSKQTGLTNLSMVFWGFCIIFYISSLLAAELLFVIVFG